MSDTDNDATHESPEEKRLEKFPPLSEEHLYEAQDTNTPAAMARYTLGEHGLVAMNGPGDGIPHMEIRQEFLERAKARNPYNPMTHTFCGR